MWWRYFKDSAADTLKWGSICGLVVLWLAIILPAEAKVLAKALLGIALFCPVLFALDAVIATAKWRKHRGDQ